MYDVMISTCTRRAAGSRWRGLETQAFGAPTYPRPTGGGGRRAGGGRDARDSTIHGMNTHKRAEHLIYKNVLYSYVRVRGDEGIYFFCIWGCQYGDETTPEPQQVHGSTAAAAASVVCGVAS